MSTKPWITADWPCPSHVKVITTLRFFQTGFLLKDFNLSPYIGIDSKLAQTNELYLSRELGIENLRWLKQVHGTKVTAYSDQDTQADGIWTDSVNQPCAVLTADCLPIVLTDNKGERVCALHAGWRGLASNIIQSALNVFQETQQVIAWLGPAIGPQSFEVGEEVLEQFKALDPQLESAFKPAQSAHHYFADLYQIARFCLQEQGVEVFGGGHDTFKEKDSFYSYRRNPNCGRMATIIWKTS